MILATYLLFQNHSLNLLTEENKRINRELESLKTSTENLMAFDPEGVSRPESKTDTALETEFYDFKRTIQTLLLAQNGKTKLVNQEERERAISSLHDGDIELVEYKDLFGSEGSILLPANTVIHNFEDGIEYEISGFENVRITFTGRVHKDTKFFEARSYLNIAQFQDENVEIDKRKEIYFEPAFMKYQDYLFTNTLFEGPSRGDRNEMVQDIFFIEINKEVIGVTIHRPLNIDTRNLETIELLLQTLNLL